MAQHIFIIPLDDLALIRQSSHVRRSKGPLDHLMI